MRELYKMSKKSEAILHVQIYLIIFGVFFFILMCFIVWLMLGDFKYLDAAEIGGYIFVIVLCNIADLGLFWYCFSLRKYAQLQEYWQELHLEGELAAIFNTIKEWLAAHQFKIKKELPYTSIKSYAGLGNWDRSSRWPLATEDIYQRRWLEVQLHADGATVSISLYETVGRLGIVKSPLIKKEVLSLSRHLKAHFLGSL